MLDTSCFGGTYITGDVDESYIQRMEQGRGLGRLGCSSAKSSGMKAAAVVEAIGGRAVGTSGGLSPAKPNLSIIAGNRSLIVNGNMLVEPFR